jgi:hypothetical protein
MGKKKIDRLKTIENSLQRNVAFCKRKRGFLKKAIELSLLCAQDILIVIHDASKNRVIQFSSDASFSVKAAYTAIQKNEQYGKQLSFEKFTNDDYQKLEMQDFRSIRYKKDVLY